MCYPGVINHGETFGSMLEAGMSHRNIGAIHYERGWEDGGFLVKYDKLNSPKTTHTCNI